MNEKEFLNWLGGFLDAVGNDSLTAEQTKKIKEKMETVVTKSVPLPYIPTHPEFPINPVYPTYPGIQPWPTISPQLHQIPQIWFTTSDHTGHQ